MAFFLEEPMLELEKYVQKEIKIERVNFECVDLKIVQDLVESLEKMLVLYPEIKPFIHAIGTRPFLQKCIDEIEIKMKEEATLEELTQMRQYLVQKESSNNPMMLFHSYMDQGQPCIMFGQRRRLSCRIGRLRRRMLDVQRYMARPDELRGACRRTGESHLFGGVVQPRQSGGELAHKSGDDQQSDDRLACQFQH